jgi:outer membrane protein OmpA-like peptidoglycan-associated protein
MKSDKMKVKVLLLFTYVLFLIPVQAQLLLPEFDKASRISDLSDEADVAGLFPFENGNALFFYRTYLEEKDGEVEIIRQNIWFSYFDEGQWSEPDRLFRMGEYPGEIMIIGASKKAERVYLLQTLYYPEEDIFKSALKYLEMKENGKWSKLKDLNIPNFEIGDRFAQLSLNNDENILLISIAENVSSENEDIFVSLKKNDGSWSEPIDLGPTINTNLMEVSPFIANDGKTLFFSSQAHGSYGGTDVFVSYRLDDSWTQWTIPQNLGDSINSESFDENFVVLSDGRYYFTSNRDSEVANIFGTQSDGEFNMNRGRGLALAIDEVASPKLSIREDVVYDHIEVAEDGSFSFMIKSDIEKVKFDVDSSASQQPLFIYKLDEDDLKLSRDIYNSSGDRWTARPQKILAKLNCNEAFGKTDTLMVEDLNGYLLGEYASDEEGVVEIPTDSIDRILNYRSKSGNCNLSDLRLIENGDLIALLADDVKVIDKDKMRAAKLSKTEQKASDRLDEDDLRVYFDFNSVVLSPEQEGRLLRFADKMKKDPSIKIVLAGFTDNVGSEEVNLEIGEKRALYVRNLLLEAGIPKNQLESKSVGEKQPLAPNDDEQGRAKNRRVEVIFKN